MPSHQVQAPQKESSFVTVPSGSIEEVSREFASRGWTDGLPIIPPTPERVDAMIAKSGLQRDEALGCLGPGEGQATVEKVAVNAVMAGCIPEVFPVVVAAIEAIADANFQSADFIPGSAPTAPLVLINGPVRAALGINSGYEVFSSGQANATIGRAVRLALLNIGGATPGVISKATQGQPGRYGMCIGEAEEESPWQPYHTDVGVLADLSTVSVFPATGTAPIYYRVQKEQGNANEFMSLIAGCLQYVSAYATSYHHDAGEPVIVLCPIHAHILAEGGWDKAKIKSYLVEKTNLVEKTGKKLLPSPRHCRVVPRADGPEKDAAARLEERLTRLTVVVAGGRASFHSTFVPTLGGIPAVTSVIRGIG